MAGEAQCGKDRWRCVRPECGRAGRACGFAAVAAVGQPHGAEFLTLLALCAGMTAIRFAISGQFQYAVFAIIAAGILDGLDGRVARLLKATSHFGAELDSLSDFVSFGVAPAAVMYLWTMVGLHSVGWAIVLFYAVCCALRLARFNTQLAAEPAAVAGEFLHRRAGARRRGSGDACRCSSASNGAIDWIVRSPYLDGGVDRRHRADDGQPHPDRVAEAIPHPDRYVMPTCSAIGVAGRVFDDRAVADADVRRPALSRLDPVDDPRAAAHAPRRRGDAAASRPRRRRCLPRRHFADRRRAATAQEWRH